MITNCWWYECWHIKCTLGSSNWLLQALQRKPWKTTALKNKYSFLNGILKLLDVTV